MDEMKRLKIHFEACPTSSLETGGWEIKSEEEKDWKMHPAVKMFDHGLRLVWCQIQRHGIGLFHIFLN